MTPACPPAMCARRTSRVSALRIWVKPDLSPHTHTHIHTDASSVQERVNTHSHTHTHTHTHTDDISVQERFNTLIHTHTHRWHLYSRTLQDRKSTHMNSSHTCISY